MTSAKFELETFLPYLLNQAAEVSSLGFQSEYKKRYGMLRTEWRVLFHLGLYGSMTAGEIGQRAKMHKTKISRAVHKLTERRFIERSRDTDDRRVEHLRLTAQRCRSTAITVKSAIGRRFRSLATRRAPYSSATRVNCYCASAPQVT